MRWIFHILTRADHDAWVASGLDAFAPPSLARDGFIHGSYAESVAESARLYFPADADLVVLRIAPTDLAIAEAETPRGPMPHLGGPLPHSAIDAVLPLDYFTRD